MADLPIYPDYNKLLDNIAQLHGELTPKEKTIAFLAYSLGGVDMVKYSKAYVLEFEDLKQLFTQLTEQHKQG